MKSLRVISLLFCLGLCLGFAAYGQTVKEKESRKARLEKEIALLDKQIRDNAARGADALSRLSLVRSKISTRQSLLEESDREIAPDTWPGYSEILNRKLCDLHDSYRQKTEKKIMLPLEVRFVQP